MSRQQFFILILIVIAITAVILNLLQNRLEYDKIVIGKKEIKIELADTALKRKEGLSNRNSLKEDTGMLFVFNGFDKYGIWMKDMKFPIDIIWIQNNKIIDIIQNASPDNQKITYYPREEANFVLEVSAGFIAENKVEIGDDIDIFF